MICRSRSPPSAVMRLKGCSGIRLERCRWLPGSGVVCVQQQRAVGVGVEVAQLLRGGGPVGAAWPVAAGVGHFGQREEEHFQAGEIVVAVGLEEGAAGVVEDLRRAGERQLQDAVGVGLEQVRAGTRRFRGRTDRRGRAGRRRRRCGASAGRRGARSRRPWWARGCIGPSRRAAGRPGSSRPGTAAPGAP